MQKSNYFIIQRTGKEITKKSVPGYIVKEDRTGLIYGVRRVNNLWQVTELSTGLLCSKSSDNINQMNKIGDYIKKISGQVKELLKARPELKKRLENAPELA